MAKKKLCRGCGRKKSLENFNKKQGRCKRCILTQQRSTPRWRAYDIVSAAKSRARKDGLTFSLTTDWAEAKILGGVCEITGVPLVLTHGRHPCSPSIDRKNPKRGYTKRNCRVVATHLNAALNSWGEGELAALSANYLMYWVSRTAHARWPTLRADASATSRAFGALQAPRRGSPSPARLSS